MAAGLRHLASQFHKDETAQGLVEYLLILAIVAFAAVAGMNTAANAVNSAFTAIATKLGQYVS